MQLLKKKWKSISFFVLFYLINFGLWEMIAPTISGEWASFTVYVVLFIIVMILFSKELHNEWKEIKEIKLKDKKYYFSLGIWLVADLLLSGLFVVLVNKFNLDILPENNDNVKNQMASIPSYLTAIQVCVFAPVIEEMAFRYSIIGKPNSKMKMVALSVAAIVLFDCIHIVSFGEFFYYLVPAVILTTFYVKNRNVWASIMLHSVINIVGMGALVLNVL